MVKKIYLIVIGSIIVLTSRLIAQPITFEKIYHHNWQQSSRDIVELADGSYLIAGFTNNQIFDDMDLYVLKVNSVGDTLWTKSYGGPEPEYAYHILPYNNFFYILGYSQSYGGGDYDAYLIKINQDGEAIWTKTYGGWGNEEGREIILTSDNHLVFVGSSNSADLADLDIFITKIDLEGNEIWTKYIGGTEKEYGNCIKLCNDGGFIIGGETFSYDRGDGDAYLIRTNANGDTIWTKTYGGLLADEIKSIICNADGSFTMAIRDSSNGSGDIDVEIMKTDSNGNIIWDKVYGSYDKDTPKTIYPTNDNGYIVGAITRSFGLINPDMWLIKLNADGDSIWTRRFGLYDHEHCHAAKQSSDGGYLSVGHSRSYSPNREFEIMFVKLNEEGMLQSNDTKLGSDEEMKVFPNPANDMIYIEFPESSIDTEIFVKNTMGQIVLKYKFQNGVNRTAINLANQAKGMYIVEFRTSNDIKFSKKIMMM